MKPKNEYGYSEISQAMRYENGELFWKINTRDYRVGDKAGLKTEDGYIKVCYERHSFMAHRVVWLLTQGEWPPLFIDHIDRCRSNNKLENLRLATHSQNCANMPSKGGSSKYKGVAKHSTGKFQAAIGKRYIGLFSSEKEAAMAYDKNARSIYGDFAVLNFQSEAS